VTEESGKLESECAQLQKQLTELKKKTNSEGQLKQVIDRLTTAVNKLEKELKSDRSAERNRLVKKLEKSVVDLVGSVGEVVKAACADAQEPLKQVGPRLEGALFKHALMEAKRVLTRKTEEFDELVDELERKKHEYKSLHAEFKKTLVEVRKNDEVW